MTFKISGGKTPPTSKTTSHILVVVFSFPTKHKTLGKDHLNGIFSHRGGDFPFKSDPWTIYRSFYSGTNISA